VRPKNVVKDFVNVAGLLNVSHMLMFTRTQVGPYLKVSRFPRGPTMTFRVDNYTLARDVRSALKRQVTYDKQYLNHPLLILNGFSTNSEQKTTEAVESKDIKRMGGREIGLVASMFQNMFPSINVTSVQVNSIRRCVLINFDPKTQTMDFRHYTIKVVPVGMSRPLKKIVQGKVPNLSRYQDMSEYLTGIINNMFFEKKLGSLKANY
jgi:ribosome biogenesis protein SSF1/2